LVDVVNSTRGAWLDVGTDALLINSRGDMAALFGIESLPLCRNPKVLRARDDSRRSCSGRGANWHYYRIVDELPEDEEISAEEEPAVLQTREKTAAGGTLHSSEEIGREFGIG
jgi:hypothetical protein